MEAFCARAGLPLHHVSEGLLDGGMATYGNARGLKPLLDRCILEKRDFLYLDNGYFKPGHFNGYFRVTRNAYMHDGSGIAKPHRWRALDKMILPWKRNADFVLVCPPNPVYASLRGFNAALWLNETQRVLKEATDREIRIRLKPGKANSEPLSQALRGCHALVTHSSNTAVDSLLAGVPVFCTDKCSASCMGIADLRRIEAPFYPDDRERFCQVLAANQWTLAEMKDGTCWRELNP
jgi:hypothetical protein